MRALDVDADIIGINNRDLARLLRRHRAHLRAALRRAGGQDRRVGVGLQHARAARGPRPRRRRRGADRRDADARRATSRPPAAAWPPGTSGISKPESAFNPLQRIGHAARRYDRACACDSAGRRRPRRRRDRRHPARRRRGRRRPDDDDRGAGAAGLLRRRVGVARAGLTARDIYRRAAPGVVFVRARSLQQTQSPFEVFPRQQENVSTGSGFVLDEKGHILTNAHVVASSTDVRVSFSDDRTVSATRDRQGPRHRPRGAVRRARRAWTCTRSRSATPRPSGSATRRSRSATRSGSSAR